jgi:hypothetical protein
MNSAMRILLATLPLLALVAGCPQGETPCDSPAACGDGNPCTEDRCVAGVCTYVETECFCLTHSDCEDDDACTTDECVEMACRHLPLSSPECTCTTAADCDPAGTCESVACSDGTCRTSAVPGCCSVATDCPTSAPCTRATCVESTCGSEPIAGCTACTTAAQCDDADACTTDTCADGTCSHAPIPGCGVPTDRTFAVTNGPEGMFVIGPGGSPFPSAFFDLAADATHVMVAGEGVSVVNLVTGDVTAPFVPWSAYGLECYRAPSGDFCAAPGPFGWYGLSTGATITDASGNATDAAASPRGPDGRSAEVLYVQADRLRAVRPDFGPPREVPATAFPGDVFPGRPTSAEYVTDDLVVILFENGELWTAALNAIGETSPATRAGDLGGAAASMRYVNCTDSDALGERVCVATNFGEDLGHVFEIDATGAVHFGPVIETGAAPVEIDLLRTVSPTGVVIGSAGFDDDLIRVHFYDGTTASLEDEGTFTDCDAPGHVAWIDETTFAVSCNGSDTLKVLGRGFD